MGTSYPRASISHQRQTILSKLGSGVNARKLNRRSYLKELSQSQSVLSPFGLGEITLKDFEVFLSGACLIKPDMSHLETWPDLFLPSVTFASFKWDFNDLENIISFLYDEPQSRIAIATAAQENYRQFVDPNTGPSLFVKHFSDLISKIERQ